MESAKQWIEYFRNNLQQKRINWELKPTITDDEIDTILPSLQAWQLGETSDGAHLLHASQKFADKFNEPYYVDAVRLFIKEEQKHGNNLGLYLDLIDERRIKKDWGDTMFRRVRYFNTNMELWTLAVITVESTAQVFYQALKDATNCELLKQICTDILIDEAYHIDFQVERFSTIFKNKSPFQKVVMPYLYNFFFYSTIHAVWFAHRKLFIAGGCDYNKYMLKMRSKQIKTIGRADKYQHINLPTFKLV